MSRFDSLQREWERDAKVLATSSDEQEKALIRSRMKAVLRRMNKMTIGEANEIVKEGEA